MESPEALTWRCSGKKDLLKILRNSQEKPVSEICNFIEKRLLHMCFPVNFAKFSRISTLSNTYERLLRKIALPGCSSRSEQNHPPEVFCKKRCSYKFCKIHWKTPVPESPF